MRRKPLEDRVYGRRPKDPALQRRRPHAHIMEGFRAYARDLFLWQRAGPDSVLLIRRRRRDN